MAISVGKLPETPSAYVIRDTKYKIKPKEEAFHIYEDGLLF